MRQPGFTVRRIAAVLLYALVASACGAAAPIGSGTTADPTGTSITTTSTSQPAPDNTRTTTTTAPPAPPSTTSEVIAPYRWPSSGGPPPWRSFDLGLPGTAHITMTHGPLGFMSVHYSGRGRPTVRVSPDGGAWRETAILSGPDGEAQVAVTDLLVTGREYVAIGDVYTQTPDGSDTAYSAVWRSPDAENWSVIRLEDLAPGARASGGAAVGAFIVLAGAIYDGSTGTAQPKVWRLTSDGSLEDLSEGFEFVSGWIEGVRSFDGEIVAWGSELGESYVLRSPDGVAWTRSNIGPFHVGDVALLGDVAVAVGSSRAWVSERGGPWQLTTEPGDFATDAVSHGFADFQGFHVLDGFLVSVANVGYKAGAAWCYADPDDCGRSVPTVLVTPNGREWRRLRLPGDIDQPDHPVEAHGMSVGDAFAVAHASGSAAVLSMIDRVEGAVPLDTGAAPDLDFEVVGPGDTIEPGVEYGYPIWTHCGLPAIGPLNGVFWVGAREPVDVSSVIGWGGSVLGFVVLTDENTLQYRVDGLVIAKLAPDPDHQESVCF